MGRIYFVGHMEEEEIENEVFYQCALSDSVACSVASSRAQRRGASPLWSLDIRATLLTHVLTNDVLIPQPRSAYEPHSCELLPTRRRRQPQRLASPRPSRVASVVSTVVSSLDSASVPAPRPVFLWSLMVLRRSSSLAVNCTFLSCRLLVWLWVACGSAARGTLARDLVEL